jgi:membrane protease YdiL (CAAX protease family)
MALLGLLIAALATHLALRAHLLGVATVQQAQFNIGYTLGSEAILYLVTFTSAFLFFPMLWEKSFFAGLQWNGATAFRLRRQLLVCAATCFLLAMLSSLWMPGPKDAPIDKIFRTPGAAWLLFVFGTTIAPICEEIIFRGFLLPALCTTVDWVRERIEGRIPLPLDANGHPQWSRMALIMGTLFTSLPFAAIHAAQTSYAWGPLVLLLLVSLILCAVRLRTRSLAASVLVHAVYNFLLFSLMLIGTGGFRHLEKL